MGCLYSIRCRNKDCRYRVIVRDKPGMMLFAKERDREEPILRGEECASEEIVRLLQQGLKLRYVATYHCPACQEWTNVESPYVLEKTHVSPYGTVREYKVHFLYGVPKCEKCGAGLIFLLNPRSSKNHCPKCGTDNMIVKLRGYCD